MALGRTIRLYLIDGTPGGPITAEIINWTGRVVLVPRAQLHEMAQRDELQRTGVYLLIGPDTAGEGERVYVGEADLIFDRLKQPDHQGREFWTRAIAISSADQNVTKAHARYLEHRLHELTQIAGRAVLDNGNTPKPKALPESDRADMEYFLQQVQLVLPVLGCDVLRPVPVVVGPGIGDGERSPRLVLKEVGAEAGAYEVNSQFIVVKGSTARREGSPSWDSYIGLRDALVKDGKLVVKNDQLYEFSVDVEFSSPSAAAAVVTAANRNGRITWRLEDGRTYAEWKQAQLEAAEKGNA
ncbi:MAG: GIY-YIG nuclease family protein [Planctomycetes bacterium]|nr:GIY-YIG nuclease family protein [Planctomycetota bacterium]